MEHQHGHPIFGLVSTLISIIAGIFGWISFADAKIIAGSISITLSAGAAFMGIRYYYYATKKIKNDLKNNNYENPTKSS